MFRLPRLENWRDALALCLLLIGLQQMGTAGYIAGKASLAQILIGRSWEASLANGGQPQKPWPWADTWPVARLQMPEHSVDLYVLSGSSGNVLAFGPGYDPASAPPGEAGISVIGGHRDTHFSFLNDLGNNAEFTLQVPTGEAFAYRVAAIRIVDVEHDPLLLETGGSDELLLVTCYPFDALRPGGPLRLVVSALPVPRAAGSPDSDFFQFRRGVWSI